MTEVVPVAPIMPDDCENGYSFLVIRFDVQFVNYDPPAIRENGMFANISDLFDNNLFDPDEVSVTIYDASTGRRQPPATVATNVNANTNDENGDNYYQRVLTLQEAFDMPEEGLRTCVPDDVCLMVGISYILPSDYSVTLYNNKGTVTTNSTKGFPRTYPYLIGGNTITFTQVGDKDADACRSKCSSPNQSLLEFDYFSGDVIRSPFWRVTATSLDSGDINFEDDDIVVEGCSYDCNYPVRRLIRKKMCLDRTTSISDYVGNDTIISTSNTNNQSISNASTTLGNDNDDDDDNNYTSSSSSSPSICYNFFLAAANHWDPSSPISPAFGLIYDGFVLRDEISFQFVSVPLGTGDNDVCIKSFNCQSSSSNNIEDDQVPFEFFLLRPYSEQYLNWELLDLSGGGGVINDDGENDNTDDYMILSGTLPSTRDLIVSNDTDYVDFDDEEAWINFEDSISSDGTSDYSDDLVAVDSNDSSDDSNRRRRHRRRLRNLLKRFDYDYDTKGNNVNTDEVPKALPVHVRKCIPIEQSKCLEFKIFLGDADEDDDAMMMEDNNNTDTDTDTTIPFESDPYQVRLNGVTYRHAYYDLGDGDINRGYNPLTGAMWHPQYEVTLMGRSCNVTVNRSASSDGLMDNLNNTTDVNTTTTTIISSTSSVCDPRRNESLFQFDFQTITADAGWVADNTHFFDFDLVGNFLGKVWERYYYVRDQDYFGNNLLFGEAYSVVQCVPNNECLGFEVKRDTGDGFPVIKSTYNVSRNGVRLTDVNKFTDSVWTTPYGCDGSFNAVIDESGGASSFQSFANNADFLLLITTLGMAVFLVLPIVR